MCVKWKRVCTHTHTHIQKSLNESIFSPEHFYVVEWIKHPNMSEWVNEPNTGNTADVSQDCQCQICHRNRIAKRRGELTHEIVHNASIIAICHSIDCDNMAVIYKACILYWSGCWEDEPHSVPVRWSEFWVDTVQRWHMWVWYYSWYYITEVHPDSRCRTD